MICENLPIAATGLDARSAGTAYIEEHCLWNCVSTATMASVIPNKKSGPDITLPKLS